MNTCSVDMDEIIEVVVELENLEVLDISMEEEPIDDRYRWRVTKEDFELLTRMPKLTDLDISGMYFTIFGSHYSMNSLTPRHFLCCE